MPRVRVIPALFSALLAAALVADCAVPSGPAALAADPTPTPPAAASVRVTSIPALLTALDDNTVTDIVVANGTYRVSPATSKRTDSLWIGARFADRTRPVTVRAETRGGVTFDGGGTTYFGGLSFVEGAHDQTWDGFNFANGEATSTGVIVFGGYAGLPPPHHITLRHIKLLSSLTGHTAMNDHGIYVSWAASPGPHDLLFEDITVDGTGTTPLSSALHFYHHDASNPNASNVTVRRLKVTGTHTAVFLWDSTVRNMTIEDSTMSGARNFGIRYEQPGTNIVLRNIVTTGSGQQGFYSSAGTNPPGVTFVNNSFDP